MIVKTVSMVLTNMRNVRIVYCVVSVGGVKSDHYDLGQNCDLNFDLSDLSDLRPPNFFALGANLLIDLRNGRFL